MLDGRIKKFKIPFDNRVETFLEDQRLQKNEYLCGMTIEDIDMMTVDVDLLLEYFNFVNDSYSNTLLILCQDGFDMFFNYVRLFNAVDDKDQEKIFNCVTVLTEKSADIFKNYSKCVREDFVKHKKDFEESGNNGSSNTEGGKKQNETYNKKKKGKKNTIDSEDITDEEERDGKEKETEKEKEKENTKEETSHMKNVFLKNSIMKLIVMRLDNNMMEYATFEKSRGCNVLEIKESLVSYFHVLTFFFINMFNMYYNKYFGKRPKLDFAGAGQRGRKKQKKALDEETCLNLKNMNTLLNNIILLICSVDFYVIYDKINIIILDLYLEFFLNVYFLNQECNNAFNMDIYYDQLAEVIFNLLQLYVKRDREEIMLDHLNDGDNAETKMDNGKIDKSKNSSGEAAKDGKTDLSHLKPIILEYISYSFADVYLETCKKCNNVRMVDAVLMLRNTNMATEILRELYIYIKKNASVCASASAQSRVQVEMNNVLTFVEYFSKNLSYQFVTFVKESVNLLGVDVPNVRKTIIDCFKNILMLAKAAEEWRERMIQKMARRERRKKDKTAAGEDTDSANEYSDEENEEENFFNEMEEEEEGEEDKEMYDEEEDGAEGEEETIGDEGAEKNKIGTKKEKGRPQLSMIKKVKGRRNMNAFLKSSSSGRVKHGGKNVHMSLMNKMLLHDERFLAICFDKCLRAREYSIYLLLTRQHDCKLHVRCHLLKIFSELVEGDFIPVIYYNDLCLICRERISDKSPLVRQRAFSLLSSIATDVVKKKYMMPLDTERIKKDLDLLIRRKVLLRKKAKEEKQIADKDVGAIEEREKRDHTTKALNDENEMEDLREKGGHRKVSTNSNGHTKKRKMNLSESDTDSDEENWGNKKEKNKKKKEGETEEAEKMKQNEQPKETTTEASKEMSELEKNIGKYDMVIQMYNDVLYIATLVDECVQLCFRLLYSIVETDQKSSIKFIILAHLCGNKLAGKQMNQVWSLIYSTNSVIVDIIIQEFLKVNIEPSDYRISAFRLINITLHSKLKDVACIEKIIQSILMQGKAAINVGKLLDELFKIVFIDTFSETKNAAIKEGGLILMKMICFSIYVTHKRRGDEVQYHTLFTEANMKDVMMFIKTFRHNFHFLNTLALILKYNETTRAVQYCMLALFNWLFLKLKLDNRHRWRPVETLSKKDYTKQKKSLENALEDKVAETDKQHAQIIPGNSPNTSNSKQTTGKEKLLQIETERARLQQKLLGNYNYLADIRCKWFKFAQSVIEGMCEHFRTFNKLVARKMRLSLKNFFRVRRVIVTTPKKIYELSSIKRHTKYRLERRYRNNITCFTLIKILFLYGHIGVYSLIHSEKIINQLKDYPCEIDNFGMYTKDEQDREYFDFVVEEKIVCDNLLGKKIVPLLFRIVRGPNTFYKKYALRKKHQGKWKLKKLMRKLQVQSIQDKNERAKGNARSIKDGRVTRARILKAIIKYIEVARSKKRKRIKIRKMKKQIARRKRRKMLRKMELVLSENVDRMSPKQIKKFLIKMKEIKRWRKNRKEKIIYRRYEMYLLFLVSLLSLCKYAIISLQFCKKKVTKHMTLIQLIVAVIVKEYKPIFSRVQRRDNFFKQGRVKVDSFGRILNLSLKPSTGVNAEVTRARVMVFGTQKQQAIMERQRQRLEKWEQKRSINRTAKMHPLSHRKEILSWTQATENKGTFSRNNTRKMRRPIGFNVEQQREKGDKIMMKKKKHTMQLQKKMTLKNKEGYCMGDAALIKGGKKIIIRGDKAGVTKVRKIRIKKVGGKIVRKTIIKNMGNKKQKEHTQDAGRNAGVKKVGRRPGRPVGSTTVSRNTQGKTDPNSNKKEGKKRGRKPKPKEGVQYTKNVGALVGVNKGEQLEGIRVRKKKKMKVRMKLRRKTKPTKVVDAQAQVMRRSVVNLRRMLLISYADLLYRHPNLLEPHNLEIFNVLSDTDVSIRKTAVAVFTHLYMTDTVKAKTVLLVHMMFLTADTDEKISGGAKSFFYELDRKAHNTLANNIADMITLVIKNERQWSHEKNKGIIEFLLYFMKKSKYSESLSEKIIRKMAEVELQNTEALNLYSLVFIHIHMDEKVLQRILGCISLIKHVIRENEYVYEKFIQVSKRAGEKRRGRPVDEAHQTAGVRSTSTLYPESGGKDPSERNEGKMKELADQLYCEVESARQNVSAWSIMVPTSATKKRYSKGKGAWDPSPGKKDKDKTPKKKDATPKKRDSTPKRTDSTPQRMNSNSRKRNSMSRKSNSFFNELNKTPSII